MSKFDIFDKFGGKIGELRPQVDSSADLGCLLIVALPIVGLLLIVAAIVEGADYLRDKLFIATALHVISADGVVANDVDGGPFGFVLRYDIENRSSVSVRANVRVHIPVVYHECNDPSVNGTSIVYGGYYQEWEVADQSFHALQIDLPPGKSTGFVAPNPSPQSGAGYYLGPNGCRKYTVGNSEIRIVRID